MTIFDNTLIEALVIIDDIPKHSDRQVVRNVINDYRFLADENAKMLALFTEIANELECIHERQYMLKAIKELKGES